LGVPWSVQFLLWGWRRSAALMVVLSTFGLWALCEQALDGGHAIAADAGHAIAPRSLKRTLLRAGRRVAGFVAGATATMLLFELFVRVMFAVIRCPGCAG
jgi:hypothetical protein